MTSMPALTRVDPSKEPFLSGRFAPVHDEIDVDDLAGRRHPARPT